MQGLVLRVTGYVVKLLLSDISTTLTRRFQTIWLGNFQLRPCDRERSHDIVRLETSVWELSSGNFRLGSLASDLWLGTFRLGYVPRDLPFGIFRERAFARWLGKCRLILSALLFPLGNCVWDFSRELSLLDFASFRVRTVAQDRPLCNFGLCIFA